MRFVSINVVHPYNCNDTATAVPLSDFWMINNLLKTVHAITRHILTSLSVDEILLPRCVNLSTNFRGLPLNVEMASSHLKHINSVLFTFTWRQCFLLPAPGYAAGIQLGLMYLQEVLYNLHCLCLL